MSVFVFLTKDSESYLETNIQTLKQLSKIVDGPVGVVYVENDSKDNTKSILQKQFHNTAEFGNRVRGIHLTLDGKSSIELCKLKSNCKSRVRRLAHLRQIALENALDFKFAKHIIIIDMDFVHIDIDVFKNEVWPKRHDADAVCGMSVRSDDITCPYDVGAIRPMNAIFPILTQSEPVRVKSAFSGFCIYSADSLRQKSAKYDLECNEIEHISLNKCLDNILVIPQFRVVYHANNSNTLYLIPLRFNLAPNRGMILYSIVLLLVILIICVVGIIS